MRDSDDKEDHFSPEEYWRAIPDEELLKMTFLTGDPDALPDLVFDVPSDAEVPFVETAYDVTGRGSKVMCAYCHHQVHYRGFVMRMRDGRRFLVGNVCGGKRYGADFNKARSAYEYARDRAELLHRRERLKIGLPAFREYLDGVRRSGAFATYAGVRQQMANTMPRLWGTLRLANANAKGALVGEADERDYAAEEREKERYAREVAQLAKMSKVQRDTSRSLGYSIEPVAPRSPIYGRVDHVFGKVEYPALLDKASLAKDFESIAEQFDNLLLGVDLPRDNRQLSAMLDGVRRLLENLEVILDPLGDLHGFFAAPHIAMLAEWATSLSTLPGEYRAIDHGIEAVIDGHTVRVHLPSDFKVPSRDGIVAFRNLINDSGDERK